MSGIINYIQNKLFYTQENLVDYIREPIRAGDLDQLRKLCNQGISLKGMLIDKKPLIRIALEECEENLPEVLKILIQFGCDPQQGEDGGATFLKDVLKTAVSELGFMSDAWIDVIRVFHQARVDISLSWNRGENIEFVGGASSILEYFEGGRGSLMHYVRVIEMKLERDRKTLEDVFHIHGKNRVRSFIINKFISYNPYEKAWTIWDKTATLEDKVALIERGIDPLLGSSFGDNRSEIATKLFPLYVRYATKNAKREIFPLLFGRIREGHFLHQVPLNVFQNIWKQLVFSRLPLMESEEFDRNIEKFFPEFAQKV